MKTLPPKQAEQGELFADSRFFILLSSLVSSQQLAKIKPHGLAVLVVLRCFADHRTGKAKITHRTIAKFAGISRHSVMRALETLETEGLVERIKLDTGDAYRLIDRISVFDKQEQQVGEVVVPFQPQKTGAIIQELKNFLQSGQVSQAARAHGMTFNINITINNNSTTINNNAETINLNLSSGTDAADEARIQRILALPSGPGRENALAVLRAAGLLPSEED
jgi:DNA-binding MarR family transcriptional regulator